MIGENEGYETSRDSVQLAIYGLCIQISAVLKFKSVTHFSELSHKAIGNEVTIKIRNSRKMWYFSWSVAQSALNPNHDDARCGVQWERCKLSAEISDAAVVLASVFLASFLE